MRAFVTRNDPDIFARPIPNKCMHFEGVARLGFDAGSRRAVPSFFLQDCIGGSYDLIAC